jgi:hypothetical protein
VSRLTICSGYLSCFVVFCQSSVVIAQSPPGDSVRVTVLQEKQVASLLISVVYPSFDAIETDRLT